MMFLSGLPADESQRPNELSPLSLPSGLTVLSALDRVLRMPSVGSKRFLTTKVWLCQFYKPAFQHYIRSIEVCQASSRSSNALGLCIFLLQTSRPSLWDILQLTALPLLLGSSLSR